MKCAVFFLALVSVVCAEMSHHQKHRCEQYTSIFENDTTELQYGYVENIHDGRGYTCGRAGFTTGTGDAVVVVKHYTRSKPNNPLAKFVPELERLARAESGSTKNLHGFKHAWIEAAKDPEFRKAQDEVSDAMYYGPAMAEAHRANVASVLGMCAIYDTIIQHGGGTDPDSLHAIVKRTEKAMGGPVRNNEHSWIRTFLQLRKQDLQHPHNKETEEEWKESVDRVDAMVGLIQANNWDMNPPMRIKTRHHDQTIH